MSGFGNLEDLGSNPGSATYESFNFSKTLTIYKMDSITSTLRSAGITREKDANAQDSDTQYTHSEHK